MFSRKPHKPSLFIFNSSHLELPKLALSAALVGITRTMQVYIAMPQENALKIDQAKKIDRASVGLPEHIRYLSFKDTRERAMQAAIAGNMMKLPLATTSYVWHVLELRVSEHDVCTMVEKGDLLRDCEREGWRLFHDLDYSQLSHQWFKTYVPAMGLDAWAHTTLTPRHQVKLYSACCKCEKKGVVWVGSNPFHNQQFCAACWFDFVMDVQTNTEETRVEN